MKKNIIKVVCFICLLAIFFGSVNSVFKFKYSDGIKQITQFYKEEENSIDVLLLGSSHAFLNIYPEILWRDFGYSSFNLSASLQPMWSTYHYLVEALKTQTPEVIVLEGYRLVQQSDYASRGTIIKSLYGMKWSKNKLEALKCSTYRKGTLDNEDELFTPAELKEMEEIPFEFINYHARYSELGAADFLPNYGNPEYEYYKGGIVGTSVYTEYEKPNLEEYNREPIELSAKTEEYYRKILELGVEKGIPVVTVIAPYYMINREYRMFLSAEKIAEEYGQMFVNYNELYDSIGLDFSTDILDGGSHLNIHGAEKFTKSLGELLQDNFDLSDHRGDAEYQSWENGAEIYKRLYGDKNGLTSIGNGGEYVDRLLSEDQYSFAVVLNGTDGEYSEELRAQIESIFKSLGIEQDGICDGVWFFEDGELEYSNTVSEAFRKPCRFDRYNDVRFEYGIASEDGEVEDFFIRKDNGEIVAYDEILTIYTYDNYVCTHVDTYQSGADGVRK